MNELALFAGAGGGILGGKLLGWRTVCAVERDAYAAQVLAQRQNDGALEPFPIWSDVCSFDGKPWRGIVDVVSGGFPCQDISAAGRGAGIKGEKSGLWKEMARIIGEVQPRFVFIENSPLLRTRGLNVVLKDLAEMGYDAKWCVLGAHNVGAPHKRDRIWILAHSACERLQATRAEQQTARFARICENVANANSSRKSSGAEGRDEKRDWAIDSSQEMANSRNDGIVERIGELQNDQQNFSRRENQRRRTSLDESREWWSTEPNVGRVANGVAFRVDRLKAIGNGQVPRVAETAWKILTKSTTSI